MKRRGRGKALGGRGTATGGAESKKKGKGNREEEIGGGSKKVSRGGETTKEENRETDEGRGEIAEAKKDRRCLLSESGSTGSSCAGAVKELVEKGESETIGVSSIQEGDESD